jgi:hypothetical protein
VDHEQQAIRIIKNLIPQAKKKAAKIKSLYLRFQGFSLYIDSTLAP